MSILTAIWKELNVWKDISVKAHIVHRYTQKYPHYPSLKLASLSLLGNYEDRGTVFIADDVLETNISLGNNCIANMHSNFSHAHSELQISERYLCTMTFSIGLVFKKVNKQSGNLEQPTAHSYTCTIIVREAKEVYIQTGAYCILATISKVYFASRSSHTAPNQKRKISSSKIVVWHV